MTTKEHFIMNLWRWAAGVRELPHVKLHATREHSNSKYLYKTEWSDEFEQLMRNRLIVGAFRYGAMDKHRMECGKPRYDRIGSILHRTGMYKKTGNLEYLVDIANLCLLEYVEGTHSARHWHAMGDCDTTHHTLIISNTNEEE